MQLKNINSSIGKLKTTEYLLSDYKKEVLMLMLNAAEISLIWK
jgi:hypothetical protein